jgi:predicted DNA-binding WGR domain protein
MNTMHDNEIDNQAMMHYARRFENQINARYYLVHVTKDLFGDWILIKAWGSINKAGGRIISIPCASYDEAIAKLHAITKTRQKHGYCLKDELI